MISPAVLSAVEVFAAIMILPTIIYFLGHHFTRPFPKVFNALHLMFGGYMASVFTAALVVLVIS